MSRNRKIFYALALCIALGVFFTRKGVARYYYELLFGKPTTEEYINPSDPDVRLAGDRETPAKELSKILWHKNYFVKRLVALNPNTTPKDLATLAKEEANEIRWAVARNTKTPKDVLAKLAKDEELLVLREVASNNNTPAEVLFYLASSSEQEVLLRVVENPNVNFETLEKLGQHKDPLVKDLSLARHAKTPLATLQKLAKHEKINVRRAVANNPGASKEILTVLAKDEDVYIKRFAKENLAKKK